MWLKERRNKMKKGLKTFQKQKRRFEKQFSEFYFYFNCDRPWFGSIMTAIGDPGWRWLFGKTKTFSKYWDVLHKIATKYLKMLEKERQRKKEILIQPGFGESKPSKLSKVTAKPLKGWSIPGKRTKKQFQSY